MKDKEEILCGRCNKPKGEGESFCKCGRPSKLPKFLEAAERILNHDINAIICTDEELIMLVNDELEPEDRISVMPFRIWKREPKEGEVDKEVRIKFRSLYEKALQKQKAALFEKFRNDDRAWQRWAWIIERKFDDWNMRHKLTGDKGEALFPKPILDVVPKDPSDGEDNGDEEAA